MKIFANNKVYVQLKDLSLIFNIGGYSIPQSVYRHSLYETIHMTADTENNFIAFSDPKEIEFFKSVDCIIDYDQYKEMSKKEYEEFILSTYNKLNSLKDSYNNAKKYFEKLSIKKDYKLECQKVIGVRESRLAYKGKAKYDMPVPVKKKSLLNIFDRRIG